MKNEERQVIVLGADHHNALGIIRSLGEMGIMPYYILISDKWINPTTFSKYIKKTYKCSCDDNKAILDLLENEFKDLYYPIIIPTGDPAAKFLDENYDSLSKRYIIQNINNKQGEIIQLMDKQKQMSLCEKYNLKHAKTWKVDLNNIDKAINFCNKVIIKPCISADGSKCDIVISDGNDVYKHLLEFKEKGYGSVLIQEFMNIDKEYSMLGIAYNNDVIISGICQKDYVYPKKRGNTAYGKLIPTQEFKYNIDEFKRILKDVNYTGLFEIETYDVNGELYFNEINFRNSAITYALTGNGVNYVGVYVNNYLDVNRNLKKYIDKEYYFCVEHSLIKAAREGQLTLKEAKNKLHTSFKIIYNKHDMCPLFMRSVNSVYLRLAGKI